MHRTPSISPVHAPRAGSLLSRTASQRALELEEGAADFVAHASMTLVMVDRGRVGVVSVVSVMGSLGPTAEDALAGGTSCGNGCSPGLAGGEDAAVAGSCGGFDLFIKAQHFNGWLCLFLVVFVV